MTHNGAIVGNPIDGTDGIRRPMGAVSDSLGNVWVSSSGVVDLPCEGTPAADMIAGDVGENGELNKNASVTVIHPVGNSRRVVKTFGKTNGSTRGGLAIPWGIAADGNDNIWVANFAGQRLTELCGARPQNCPPGKRTGDPISPDTGYGSPWNATPVCRSIHRVTFGWRTILYKRPPDT